jgi:5-methyltetrahydrofolate--homocysteine methyltransferase
MVQAAVAERDADYIINDVTKQQKAGATFIDVNAGARIGHETEDMKWLLDTIQPIATVPLALDSPDPAVLEMAFVMVEKTPLINSISLEKERFDAMIPFLEGKACKVVALCMDDAGMPTSSDDILARATTLVEELNKIGIPTNAIYTDPLVQPISTDSNKGLMVLDAVRAIKAKYPEVHITGGLSNISYGLPQRHMINKTFVALMMDAGMDSAIIAPLDAKRRHSSKSLILKSSDDKALCHPSIYPCSAKDNYLNRSPSSNFGNPFTRLIKSDSPVSMGEGRISRSNGGITSLYFINSRSNSMQ